MPHSSLKWKMGKETGGIDSECTAVKNREWMRPGAKNALVEGGVNITPGFDPVSICMFPSVMHRAQW